MLNRDYRKLLIPQKEISKQLIHLMGKTKANTYRRKEFSQTNEAVGLDCQAYKEINFYGYLMHAYLI